MNRVHSHVILLVDDYDDTREGFAAVLRLHGITVETAWGGEDALRHFREGVRPCVALIDLRMPGMDGWSLWERMRADPNPDLAELPIVIVTGDMNARTRAYDAGVREFLTKPVEPGVLVSAIERTCKHTARPSPATAPDRGRGVREHSRR